MKVGLATSHERMAPCFAGVDLRIVKENATLQAGQASGQAELDVAQVVSTHGWHPLGWGRELMRRDIGLLLGAGIDQGTWAAIQGHGIAVIPNAIGDAGTVLIEWRSGDLTPPQLWPAYPGDFGRGSAASSARGGRW